MISSETQRVFHRFSAASSLSDISPEMNDFREGTFTGALNTGLGSHLYIGQYLPFVSRYFDVSGNVGNGSINVEYWDGTDWQQALDIRDGTEGAKPFEQSGYLTWTTDRDGTGWSRECESQDVIGLEDSPQIYDFYWIRISFLGASSNITFSFIGNLFSTDDDMYSHYPELDDQNTRNQWDVLNPGSKTDWIEQGFIAAEVIIRDLKTRNIILEDGQVFDVAKFNVPSIHKQANIIYGGLGRGYQDQIERSEKAYQKAMSLGRMNIDKHADGRLSGRERSIRTEFATR